jgi:sulfur carrier protein
MPRSGRRGLCGDRALPVIVLQINGKEVQLNGPTSLLDYLEKLGVSPRAVAIEHNGAIIERDAYARTTLNHGDAVEIVRMVGGGSSPLATFGVPALVVRGGGRSAGGPPSKGLTRQSQLLADRGFSFGPLVPRL